MPEGKGEKRTAEMVRNTNETQISAKLNLDGSGAYSIATPSGFLCHMLEILAKHAALDLTMEAQGDVHIDLHHTVEDTGIVLGQCLAKALGDKKGIRRMATESAVLDESKATVTVDLSGRPFLVWNVPIAPDKVGEFDTELAEDFFRGFAMNGGLTIHVQLDYGKNGHHIIECVFKATARAIRKAAERDERVTGVPSTKGVL